MYKKNPLLIFILGMLSGIGPFSIDSYIPGFPKIAADFGINIGTVSYTLSSFFIGICAGQIIVGPLSDRFGRKKPLLIGLMLYTTASLGCAVSASIEMLIVLRFFQALGGCVGLVCSRAIVRDIFPVHEMAKIFSLLILILGVSPIIAPSAGSFIIARYGWQSVFWLHSCMGLFLFIMVLFTLPESKKADTSISLRPGKIIKGFLNVFKTPQFYSNASVAGIISGGVYAFLAGSPTVFMKIHGASTAQYGFFTGLVACGFIASSQVNALLLKKYTSIQLIKIALRIQLAFGFLLFMGSIFHIHTLYSTLGLCLLFMSCQGFIQPNATALSLAPFTQQAGSASALIGALQMSIAALASVLVGSLSNGTSQPMTGVMMACSIIGFVIFSMRQQFLKVK